MSRFHIDFLGHRKIMFAISGVLLVVSIAALLLPSFGLKFGIEFQGGTSISVVNSGEVTIEQMRKAFEDAGVTNPNVQTTEAQGVKGFIIRTEVTDPDEASGDAAAVAVAVKLPADSFQVTTIGPGWGKNVTNRALMALGLVARGDPALHLGALRVQDVGHRSRRARARHPDHAGHLRAAGLRGHAKHDRRAAHDPGLLALRHHRGVPPHQGELAAPGQAVVHRWRRSINEVFMRSLNTTITSLIPVLVMLFFGGETLKDFALALSIGLLVGAYSSIGVALPLYAMWKESEPKYAALKKKYADA